MQDVRFGPDPPLLTEMERFQKLEPEATAEWSGASNI